MMFTSSSQRNVEINQNCGTTLEQAYNPEQLTLVFGNLYLYIWIVFAYVMNVESP